MRHNLSVLFKIGVSGGIRRGWARGLFLNHFECTFESAVDGRLHGREAGAVLGRGVPGIRGRALHSYIEIYTVTNFVDSSPVMLVIALSR